MTYGVVLQILNIQAGDLQYAGKGAGVVVVVGLLTKTLVGWVDIGNFTIPNYMVDIQK